MSLALSQELRHFRAFRGSRILAKNPALHDLCIFQCNSGRAGLNYIAKPSSGHRSIPGVCQGDVLEISSEPSPGTGAATAANFPDEPLFCLFAFGTGQRPEIRDGVARQREHARFCGSAAPLPSA